MFRSGAFKLASGVAADWKIDCDYLTRGDWGTIAHVVARMVAPFGAVEGVPRGGLPFAEALKRYVSPAAPYLFTPLLIVDDVLTTGGSMERLRAGRDAFGVVLFARGPCPEWVTPLFTLNPLASV